MDFNFDIRSAFVFNIAQGDAIALCFDSKITILDLFFS